MKFTLSWLKEYLDTNASVNEISEKLTSIGLEVESVQDFSAILKPFTVAEILETEQHPQADRLRICKVNAGNGEVLSIVCGASNARAGIKIPLARIGTIIPNGNFEIKKSKIRGTESNGMLCSAEELNLAESSEGILELPENSEIGKPIASFIGRDDSLFEIAITPNRGDCLGVYGIARDLSATGIGKLKEIKIEDFNGSFESPIKVNIEANAGKYFVGVYIKNITTNTSPDWLKKKLESIGKKSISAAVDITNYLTFAFGRPAHVYDADKLKGNLSIRFAKEGEKIKALNGTEYNLTPDVSVIADENSPVAIAGIIGGEESGCSENTKNIFLEIANFDHEIVSKVGRQLQIDSDARYRFDRQIDHLSYHHYKTAIKLINEICGGEPSKPVIAGNTEYNNKAITFDFSKVKKITGIDIAESKANEILSSLGFKKSSNGSIAVPSWRNDVSIEEDLAEEIARIHGLDNIPVTYMEKPAKKQNALNPFQKKLFEARKVLTSQGSDEIVTFSFTNSKFAKEFTSEDLIEVANPISSDLDVMRPSTIINLIDALAKNIARSRNNLNLFEVGNIFSKQKGEFIQRQCVAGVSTGSKREKSPHYSQENIDVFDVKGDCESVLSLYMDPSKMKTQKNQNFGYYHPGKSGCYMIGNQIAAVFGEIHPEIVKKFDIKQKIFGFEVFIDNLPQPKPKAGYAKKLLQENNLQIVERDFAFVLDKTIPVNDIISAIRKAQKDFIEDVRIFDVYEGDKVGEGKKSVAVKVILQPKDTTMTDEQIEQISKNLVSAVGTATNAVLR